MVSFHKTPPTLVVGDHRVHERPEINKHLSRSELAKLCDPANYLGQSGVMVDRVLASLR